MGGLSEPSKMPGLGTSTPASECITGSKLREIPGSVCHGCYAMKNRYTFTGVQTALKRRLERLKDPLWVPAMVRALAGQEWFRWYDSGDLQGEWHLRNIIEVCRQTPTVRHWLPTREYKMVRNVLAKTEVPPNLCIRLSEHMVDEIGPAVKLAAKLNVTASGVAAKKELGGRKCPALSQGNSCGTCRSCWDKEVPVVIYPAH